MGSLGVDNANVSSDGQVTTPIENAIEAYFQTLRKSWGAADEYNDYSLGIYISRITAAILTVPGRCSYETYHYS